MSDKPIVYSTMRFSIPEGGEVVLHVPAHTGTESLKMAQEAIAIQMRIFLRHAEMHAAAENKDPQP